MAAIATLLVARLSFAFQESTGTRDDARPPNKKREFGLPQDFQEKAPASRPERVVPFEGRRVADPLHRWSF